MKNQLPWDIYESAMLMEAYQKIEQNKLQRYGILRGLSADLRARAVKKGNKIDAVFRNVNGMNLQYERFRYMMTDGKWSFRGPIPKYFWEIKEMYETDFSAYEKILKEAKGVEEEADIQSPTPKEEAAPAVVEEEEKPAPEKEKTTESVLSSPRRQWDQWEWALFLEAYEEIEKTPESKNQILQRLSDTLRKRAVNNGFDINETFRNLNGMKLQYKQVLYAMTKGKRGLKGNLPKTFKEAQDIYYKDKDWFELLLRKAKKDAGIDVPEKEKKTAPITVVNGVVVHPSIPKIKEISLQGVPNKDLYRNICDLRLSFDLESKLYGQKIHTMQELTKYFNEGEGKDLSPSERSEIYSKLEKYLNEHRSHGPVDFFAGIKAEDGGKSLAAPGPALPIDDLKEEAPFSLFPEATAKASAEQGGFSLSPAPQQESLFAELSTSYGMSHTVSHNPTGKSADSKADEKASVGKKQPQDSLAVRIDAILAEHFSDGFKPNQLKTNKFQNLFAKAYGEQIPGEWQDVVKKIRQVGVTRDDGRIYVKVGTDQKKILQDVADALVALFEGGATAVDRECFYEKHRDELAELSILAPEVMEKELKKILPAGYRCFHGTYHGKSVRADGAEIVDFIHASPCPVPDKDILSRFWYIPEKKINSLLKDNKEIIHAQKTRFDYRNLAMTDEERVWLRESLHKAIWDKVYLSEDDILTLLKEEFPSIAADVATFPPAMVRRSLASLYPDDFVIVGGNLTDTEHNGTAADALRDLCRKHTRLTTDGLALLREKINFKGNYGSVVMEEMVRIDSNNWVRRDQVHFSGDIPDCIAEIMGEKECIPIREMSGFLTYPEIGVKWNIYVLESYLYKNDGACPFRLLQASGGVSATNVYGVMAKESSHITDYKSAVIYLLARDDAWSNEKEALDRIVAMGLQFDRRMNDSASVVKAAKAERDRLKQ